MTPTQWLVSYIGDHTFQLTLMGMWIWYVICNVKYKRRRLYLVNKHPELLNPPNVRLKIDGVSSYGTK